MSGACQWSERGSTTTTFSAVSPRAGGNHLGGHPDFLVVLKGDHQLDGVVQENRHGLRCETRSEVPPDLWAPNRVQQKVWWRSGLHVGCPHPAPDGPAVGFPASNLCYMQSRQKVCLHKNLIIPPLQEVGTIPPPWASAQWSWSAGKKISCSLRATSCMERPAQLLCRACHTEQVSTDPEAPPQQSNFFVKLSLSYRCGILRPLEVISFAFAIACSLKSENWKGKAMCCQEASISSDDLPAPFPQLIGSAGGSPLATSAGSHAGTLDPSDPGSHIQAWIHIPVVGGVDDTPAGMAFVWLWALRQQLSSADTHAFPLCRRSPFCFWEEASVSSFHFLPASFAFVQRESSLGPSQHPSAHPPAREPESLCLHPLVRGLGGVWGYPLGAFRPPYACHTKQGSATFETSKSNHFWSNPHRHGHRALMRMVADGCEQLRNV